MNDSGAPRKPGENSQSLPPKTSMFDKRAAPASAGQGEGESKGTSPRNTPQASQSLPPKTSKFTVKPK